VPDTVAGFAGTDETPRPPWRARKEAYVRHLEDAPASVRLVSAADKLFNARAILRDYRAIGDELWRRFTGGKEGTLWYYRFILFPPRRLAFRRAMTARRYRPQELGQPRVPRSGAESPFYSK